MIFAAIVAGGTGSRMGADIPKQFLHLGGKPVLIRTIERFLNCGRVDEIFVGVHSDWTDRLADDCAKFGLNESKIHILAGGENRDATVRKIITEIAKQYKISDSDIILTHDGVRPFVSDGEIFESIGAMEDFDGATLCLPSTDTLLYSDDGEVTRSVPERSKYFRALTPQTFKLARLISAYDSLTAEQCQAVTDTASVFALAGLPVKLVEGSPRNIKLTTPQDMRIAEFEIAEEDY